MKGKIQDYPLKHGELLCRWFVSYEDRLGRYTEENFDTKREAVIRIGVLTKGRFKEVELWTRERAIPEERLRPRLAEGTKSISLVQRGIQSAGRKLSPCKPSKP